MADQENLIAKVLEFLNEKINKNYRIIVAIVGPPGSGKSTIAKCLQDRINDEFSKYLLNSGTEIIIRKPASTIELLDKLESANERERHVIQRGFYSKVEDYGYRPLKIEEDNGSIVIAGRGGLPNSIRIRNARNIELSQTPKIAQMVPMDGFHLSRAHLDHFTNPQVAYDRRGAPFTFDSANYLELCRILAKTTAIRPPPSTTRESNIFEKLSKTFLELPEIHIPGFDHSRKDPTIDEHLVDGFSRILILEGLYLLLNEENWAKIYDVLSETDAVVFFNIDIEDNIIEQRVATRHLEAGITKTLAEGVERFRTNDFLNAKLIKQNSIKTKNVINIRND